MDRALDHYIWTVVMPETVIILLIFEYVCEEELSMRQKSRRGAV